MIRERRQVFADGMALGFLRPDDRKEQGVGMCGIAGLVNVDDVDIGRRMLARIAHRGPVGEGEHQAGNAWLGHRRCAAADAHGGAQPVVTGGLAAVTDAAIYNETDLRDMLKGKSGAHASNGTLMLELFRQVGSDVFAQVNGMFAVLIAGEDGQFVAARDPLGVKPLYWARQGDRVAFASEIGAFDASWRAEIEFFPPGHYWTVERGLVQFADAVPLNDDKTATFEHPMSTDSAVPEAMLAQIRQHLVQAVERQWEDGVPVGVFLSGGLDSSIIAAIAAARCHERGERLKTFAVGHRDAPDLAAARSVAASLDTDHAETTYTAADALDAVPEVVRTLESFDPSLVRSAVANHLLATFAAPEAKVVLTGEGADEIFAGYEYLKAFDTEEELQRELIHGLEEGHGIGLQRLDRMPMAQGIEARVPFLDRDVVKLGFSIPAGWKFPGKGQPEKRLLREAFGGWLPDEILWRKKAQFGAGSGAQDALKLRIEESIDEEAFDAERDAIDPPLRTREELAYFRVFNEHLAGVRPKQVIGRFATA